MPNDTAGNDTKNTGFADQVFRNARIYTVNLGQPWGQAVAVREGRIVYVGDDAGVKKWIGQETRQTDLKGKLMLPGLVDSHTHPGLTAMMSELAVAPFTAMTPLPYTSPESMLAWLEDYARKNPDLPCIAAGIWREADFGPEGPQKEALDRVVPDRPVFLMEQCGHSAWLNSKAFEVIGVTRETPGLAYYQRDGDGNPTGFAKEGACWSAMCKLVRAGKKSEQTLAFFLEFLSAHGVTTLFDAGNLGWDEEVYSAISRMEREGRLPFRYEACYHIYVSDQIDEAVAQLKRLRSTYGSKKLKFNTIKIHHDGMAMIHTAALIDPYTDDVTCNGGVVVSEARLTEFIRELHREKIDLHLHNMGDRSTREALNAYETVRQEVGGELNTRLTLSHLMLVHDDDFPRFSELGVVSNFTPGWNEPFFKHIVEPKLGEERSRNLSRIRPILDGGSPVSFSSDSVSLTYLNWANPFLGMQVGMNRQKVEDGRNGEVLPPLTERLTLEEMIRGYTRDGAYQLRLDGRLGSVEVGKSADLVMMKDNLFDMDRYKVHKARVESVWMAGEEVYRRNWRTRLKELAFDLLMFYYYRIKLRPRRKIK